MAKTARTHFTSAATWFATLSWTPQSAAGMAWTAVATLVGILTASGYQFKCLLKVALIVISLHFLLSATIPINIPVPFYNPFELRPIYLCPP